MNVLRTALFVLVAFAVAFGIWYKTTEPPNQLSQLDALLGGGAGVERVAEGVAFGANGQKLDVWRPDGGRAKEGEVLPVVVFFYGGGWHAGSRQGYAFVARGLASRGFLVVVPDYRKVPTVRFPAFVEDGADALKWVHDHVADYGGDPARVAVAGHSAGAHIAAMLALDTRYLAERGIDRRFVKAAIGLSGPYDFLPLDPGNAENALGNWPNPAETQPITYARADAPPMLLVTSSKDMQVKPRNAYRLARRLKQLGAPVMLRDYAGLSHENVVMAYSRPFRRLAPVLDQSVAFLDTAFARGREKPSLDRTR